MVEIPTVASEYGRAIIELEKAGWTQDRISRHIGCHRTRVCVLRSDPCVVPTYVVGERLLELRDNVRAGMSRWSRIIICLRSHGYSTAKLSVVCDVSRQAILDMESDPAYLPSHDIGQSLIALYRRHVEDIRR